MSNREQIGVVTGLTRYPVKSMGGVEMDSAELGWHGLTGDRRFGVRQVASSSGFPWLSASKLPDLLMYRPCAFDESSEMLPTQVRTPSGQVLDLASEELRSAIGAQCGCEVELMQMKHGIFDDAPVSIITPATVERVCDDAEINPELRRFRANVVVSPADAVPFSEDRWVGQTMTFGDHAKPATVAITKRDVRCKMIGLDPDTVAYDPRVLKSVVDQNDNNAGVYGCVLKPGTINVGDPVFLQTRPAVASQSAEH